MFKASEMPDLEYTNDLIPKGIKVNVVCTKAEEKTSKKGDKYLSLWWKIEEEQHYAGKVIFETYMLEGNGGKIGMGRMKDVMRVNAVEELDGAQAFEGLKMNATIGISKGKGGYDDSNTFSSVRPHEKTDLSSVNVPTPSEHTLENRTDDDAVEVDDVPF